MAKKKSSTSSNIQIAKSWPDLQRKLYANSWNPSIKRYRSQHAFRGMSNEDYPLTTGLMRLGGPYRDLETHLVRSFVKYAHRDVDREEFWYWLSMAQHHGLPTRLLDWTYSPLVALHFAVSDPSGFDTADAVVWKVDYAGTHKLLPKEIYSPLRREGGDIFNVELLSESVPDLKKLDGHSSRDANYALFFEPPSLDERIVNQFAYFSVLTNPELAMDDWLAKHKNLWKKIVIPKALKWEVRDKLDQSNITERVLFTGIDGLTAWLKRHYTPRK